MAALLENLATAALTVLSLALVLIAWRAWRHTGSPKILLLALAFLLFLAKGVLLSVALFTWPDWKERVLTPLLVVDLLILLLLYAAVLKRSRR